MPSVPTSNPEFAHDGDKVGEREPNHLARDMISAGEPRVFVPLGREALSSDLHAGALFSRSQSSKVKSSLPEHEPFKTPKKFSNKISGSSSEFWRRRVCPSAISSSSSSRCDYIDELYVKDSTAVWTREGQETKPVSFDASDPDKSSRSAQLVRTYTVDSQIKDAAWTTFKNKLCHGGTENNEFKLKSDVEKVDCVDQPEAPDDASSSEESLVILESTILTTRSWKGNDHVTFLPFPVARMWPIKDGILVERDTTGATDADESAALATMFTLSHPLDEFKPVLTRVPASSSSASSALNYVTDPNTVVVFASRDPSLLVSYDRRSGLHSAWIVKSFVDEPEALSAAPGQNDVPVVAINSTFVNLTSDISNSPRHRPRGIGASASNTGSSLSTAFPSKNTTASTGPNSRIASHSPSLNALQSSTMSRLAGVSSALGSSTSDGVSSPSNAGTTTSSSNFGSPFRHFSSRLNSPSNAGSSVANSRQHSRAQSRAQSPSISHMATLSRCQTPSPSRTESRLPSAVTSSQVFGAGANQTPEHSRVAFARPWTPGTPRTPRFAGTPRGSISTVGESFYEQVEPLPPEVFLDLVWTESHSRNNVKSKKPVSSLATSHQEHRSWNNAPTPDKRASKVDLARDFSGQNFLCLLTPFSQSLSLIKIEFPHAEEEEEQTGEGGDKRSSSSTSKLIFGSTTVLPNVKDFGSFVTLSTLIVLDTTASLVLYSGTVKIGKIYVGGSFASAAVLSASRLAAPKWSPAITGNVATTPVAASAIPSRMAAWCGQGVGGRVPSTPIFAPTSSNRPSVSPDQFVVNDLSPVPTELSTTLFKSVLFKNSRGTPSPEGPSCLGARTPTNVSNKPPSFGINNFSSFSSIEDARGNVLTLKSGADDVCISVNLPSITTHSSVRLCLDAFLAILPKDLALNILSQWYLRRNSPGGAAALSGHREWNVFCEWLMGVCGYDVKEFEGVFCGGRRGDSTMEVSSGSSSDSTEVRSPKCTKSGDSGGDEDWETMMLSSSSFASTPGNPASGCVEEERSLLLLPSIEKTLARSPSEKSENPLPEDSTQPEESRRPLSACQPLFPYLPSVFYSLYLVYEEMKLTAATDNDYACLCVASHALHALATDIGYVAYLGEFERDLPEKLATLKKDDAGSRKAAASSSSPPRSAIVPEDFLKLHFPSFIPTEPTDVYRWLSDVLADPSMQSAKPFHYIPKVTDFSRHLLSAYLMFIGCSSSSIIDSKNCTKNPRVDDFIKPVKPSNTKKSVKSVKIAAPIASSSSSSSFSSESVFERVTLHISKCGLTAEKVSALPFGVSLLFRDAIFRCRWSPPSDWPEDAYRLIDRPDLLELKRRMKHRGSIQKRGGFDISKVKHTILTKDSEQDGMEIVDDSLLRLLYKEDLRVQEVRKLLQSSKPVVISVVQRPEVTDHDFVEEQERALSAFCVRTMALSVGRGIFTLHTTTPIITETLPIPTLNLTGRATPRNTTVELTHIEVPANMNAWPSFHNGVAAGLKLVPYDAASSIASAWITFNCPKSNNPTNEHAGFLMALGLNGHLSRLTTLNIHDYLCRGHDFTGVGLLLGIATAYMGSMDVATTRVLSIHVGALLPPTSTELDVSHVMQVAAVMSVGLVYAKTAHRHMAEVLLGEIGRPPGPEMENSVDRESYSLAAGLALGFVTLGKGEDEQHGLSDLSLSDQLYHFMVGGTRRPLTGTTRERYRSPSYQIKEGNAVNTDVTSPGATLALGMMFHRTGNQAVAGWMEAPDTQFLLEFVRPDFLLLRILAKGLILWDEVMPSRAWLDTNIPEIIRANTWSGQGDTFFPDDADVDVETMTQARCNIEAGACMVIGLRFAGTANRDAFQLLHDIVDKFLRMQLNPNHPASIAAGKSTLESCLVTAVVSLAMVMAGSGNLEVLRICRLLHARVGAAYSGYVTYGSHMAVHMALGLLFMGGGRYTLGNSDVAVAAMLCAFFPKWPVHSNDNRYHLQALRHLYVIAAEKRILVPVDVDSKSGCYVPVELEFKQDLSYFGPTKFQFMAPCMLPDLNLLSKVTIKEPRYWPVEFERGKNWDTLTTILRRSGEIFVKQRAGHLDYDQDPKGYRSQLIQSLSHKSRHVQRLDLHAVLDDGHLRHLSSDADIQAFARLFCTRVNDEGLSSSIGASCVNGVDRRGLGRRRRTVDAALVQTMTSFLQECVADEKPEALAVLIEMIEASNVEVLKDGQIVQDEEKIMMSPLIAWQLRLVKEYSLYLDERLDQIQSSSSFSTSSSSSDSRSFISPKFIRGTLNLICRQLERWAENNGDIVGTMVDVGFSRGNQIPSRKGADHKLLTEEKDNTWAEEEDSSTPRCLTVHQLRLAKCYEIMFGRRVGSRDLLEKGVANCEDANYDDESADFLKAYCDNRNSFVFGAV